MYLFIGGQCAVLACQYGIQLGQREAFAGMLVKQKGHSLVAGGAGSAVFLRCLQCCYRSEDEEEDHQGYYQEVD